MSEALNGVGAALLRLVINGTITFCALSATVTTNNTHTAARFDLKIIPDVDPAFNADWWSRQKTIPVDIQVGTAASTEPSAAVTWKSLLIGRVDSVKYNPETKMLTATGRDRIGDLIELKTFEPYKNQSSSQVVTLLAAKVVPPLSVVAQATTTPVGRYYEADHDKMTLGQFHRAVTAWDLIVQLAEYEGFDAYVVGDTLYFQPQKVVGASPPDATLIVDTSGEWTQASGQAISFDRSLTMAKNITVVVKSFNSRVKGVIQGISGPGGSGSGGNSGKSAGKGPEPERYVKIIPNLRSNAEAQQKAESIRRELTRHERLVTYSSPGGTHLTPRSILRVVGSGTAWDQDYFISSIERTVSVEEGFYETIHLKNQSPTLSENVF